MDKTQKKLRLEKAIGKFIESDNVGVPDFMELFYEVHSSLKQGNGLLWEEVEECLKNVLD